MNGDGLGPESVLRAWSAKLPMPDPLALDSFPPWPARQSVPPDATLKGAGGDAEAGCCPHGRPGPPLRRKTQHRPLKYLLPRPVGTYGRILRAAEPRSQEAGAACQPWNSVAWEPRIRAKAWERPEQSEVSSLLPQRQQPPLGLAPRVCSSSTQCGLFSPFLR